MAIATAFVPTSMPSEEIWYGNLDAATSSIIVINDGFRKTEYFGSFSYPNLTDVSGILNSINEYRGDTLIYSVNDIGADAGQMYEAIQILADFDLAASISLANDDTLNGSLGDDYLRSYAGNDLINGNGGDDTLDGGAGNDQIDGGTGVDTAVYSGTQSSHTLMLSATSTTIADRLVNGNGSDTLIDMELLEFDTGTFSLNQFGGTTGLSEQNFESFIELYIAYFNRAPDAIGLNFWGTAFANGTSLEEMAILFVDQDETLAAYPSGTSNSVFAETVYNNVLGRTPDQAGFDFWVGQLDSDSVSRDQFILEVLRGVQPGTPDEGYLDTKVDIGAYFAVHKGMSDTDNASAAMALFDGTQASVDTAVAAIDGYYADASDLSGEFLLQVVGVLDDPFAGA